MLYSASAISQDINSFFLNDETLKDIVKIKKCHNDNKKKQASKNRSPVATLLMRVLDIPPVEYNTIFNMLESFSTYNVQKLSIASLLLNRWCYTDDCVLNTKIFFKHVLANDKKNMFYQIILGSGISDGVYTLSFTNKTINIASIMVDTATNKKILNLECPSNYDIAEIPGHGSILRCECESEKDFIDRLVESSLITRKELSLFHNPNKVTLTYLEKNLPNITFY